MHRRVRVVVVGSGNVAECFVRAISRHDDMELVQLFARNPERGCAVARMASVSWCGCPEELAEADIYIVAVSDRAVGEVAASLPLPREALLVHTAGSVPLAALPERGGRCGIIYPLQSFSAGREVDLESVPLFVEGGSEAVTAELLHFAGMLSQRVAYADSERRRVLHLAGVLVNNFVNTLYAAGAAIVEREGLSFEVLKPLIVETAAKAASVADPRSVQTGPAVRGDRSVSEQHLAMLAEDEELQRIYNDLTRRIWETSKRI